MRQNLQQIYSKLLDEFGKYEIINASRSDEEVLKKEKNKYEKYFIDTNSSEFIQDKFNYYEKQKVLRVPKFTKNEIFAKDTHMLSVYLLGFYFRKLFICRIKEQLEDVVKEYIKDNSDYENFYKGLKPFEYLWFLTALYHDVTTKYEDDVNFDDEELNLTDGFALIKECIYKQLEYKIEQLVIENGEKFPFTHKPEEFADYFRMKFCEEKYRTCGRFEHGVVSGNILYDILIKNLNEKLEGKSHNINGGLYWNENDKILYMFAADAIMAHNMWYVKAVSSDSKLYKKYNLDGLVYDKKEEKRLSIKDNPLAFLLGLADTIEPVKAKQCFKKELTVSELLESIDVETTGNEIILSSKNLKLGCWYKEKFKEVENWLQLKTKYEWEKNTIHIRLDDSFEMAEKDDANV